MDNTYKFLFSRNFYITIAIIISSFAVYEITKKLINRFISKVRSDTVIDNRKRTYLRMFNSILKYIVLGVIVIVILQVNNINVSSIVAGIGLVSVIAGLALQDALKDIIMGFNIIIDGYFSVGDVVKIDNIEGKVIEIGLKATKMKDVNTENFFVVANRNISQALVLSKQLDIDVPMHYELEVSVIESVMQIISKKISELKNVENAEYKGINEFADSAMIYKIRIHCNPEFKPQIKREANRIIKLELDENGINIPYKQIDIHNK